MKRLVGVRVCVYAACLLVPSTAFSGRGYMGGSGGVVVDETPADVPPDEGGVPDDVSGPLNDNMADSGKLFGDLYRILRQQGNLGDAKLVPEVSEAGEPVLTNDPLFGGPVQLFVEVMNTVTAPDAVIGGEPVLTVIDPGMTNTFDDYGWYAAEIGVNPDETPIYGAARSPYPAMCVQPVANFARWGDISPRTGLSKNRLPMVITYDATWNRSECEVGKLTGAVVADPVTGVLDIPIDPWFVGPGETWTDPINGEVTYVDGVLWADLVEEVGFGRLNISRSPQAVLQSAFDEAITSINSAVAIEIDAAGRLLLTRNVYDPLLVDPDTGWPLLIDTVKKAIDSPLENVALYVKLMQDGHLVTPGDEREPIDRSKNGGIPLWKMLELEDGPADAALRPTIDIAKLRAWGLGELVDVDETVYYTYFQCVDADAAATACLCWNDDPNRPELDGEWVACDDVVERALFVVASCPAGFTCEGPFTGITTDGDYQASGADLSFAASFLAAAADKTGVITVDMVVYLNSILGINKVLGTSEDGTVDYKQNPVYFNYRAVADYDRGNTFAARGEVVTPGGAGNPSSYDGSVTVLQGDSPLWTETVVPINGATMNGASIFEDIGLDASGFPNHQQATDNILGFTQQSHDDLSVIKLVHTYQVPSLR